VPEAPRRTFPVLGCLPLRFWPCRCFAGSCKELLLLAMPLLCLNCSAAAALSTERIDGSDGSAGVDSKVVSRVVDACARSCDGEVTVKESIGEPSKQFRFIAPLFSDPVLRPLLAACCLLLDLDSS